VPALGEHVQMFPDCLVREFLFLTISADIFGALQKFSLSFSWLPNRV
jgi:hypothetical protein